MKAKVWMSLPTPMKDRKRTRHSTMTSSSFCSGAKGLSVTTGCSVELSVLIKWEDILIDYCNSFLSVWPKHAQAWAGSPPLGCHWGFEHYHRILKCCTLWKLLVLWRNQQHGYMGIMTPKYAPLSLVCYRDDGLVPHQKTYIKYTISKSHCTKLCGKCSTFFSVTQIFILLLAPIPRVRQMQFGI